MKEKNLHKTKSSQVKRFWYSLHTGDKYLLILLGICFLHSIFTLFIPINSGESSPVDIVTRTTAAAIFGYFISSNFSRQNSEQAIDFGSNVNTPSSSEELTNINTQASKQNHQSYLKQIRIIAIIGTVSLFILLSANYTNASVTHTAAAASQLRDFIMGSVGFLISGTGKSISSTTAT